MRRLPFAALIAEGLLAGLGLAARIPTLAVYTPITLVAMTARGLVGAALLTAGWLLLSGRPQGAAIGRAALVIAPLLYTVDVAWRLTPTSLDPSFRWPAVVAYWVYTLSMRTYISRSAPRQT